MDVRRFIKKRQRLFLFSKPRFVGGGLKSVRKGRDKGDMGEMKGNVIDDVKGVY